MRVVLLFVLPSPPSMYTFKGSVPGHLGPINCVAFSSDGQYMASADGSGLLLITELARLRPGETKADVSDRYHFKSSITSLLWMPGSHRLYVGQANCELHILPLGDSVGERAYALTFAPEEYDNLSPEWQALIQINCLSFDAVSDRLAIALGASVIVISAPDFSADQYEEVCALNWLDLSSIDPSAPPPKVLPTEVRGVHFSRGGQEVLVTFLEDGIHCYSVKSRKECWTIQPRSYRIGRSAVDRAGQTMVCSNLYDGFDIYDIGTCKHLRTIHEYVDSDNNVPLPVLFIHNDAHVLCGTANGRVTVAATREDDSLAQFMINHHSDVIQSVAYVGGSGSPAYIATGSANPDNLCVRLWQRKPRIQWYDWDDEPSSVEPISPRITSAASTMTMTSPPNPRRPTLAANPSLESELRTRRSIPSIHRVEYARFNPEVSFFSLMFSFVGAILIVTAVAAVRPDHHLLDYPRDFFCLSFFAVYLFICIITSRSM
ncbi:hypothetical protein D9611_009734 [Ephemerocybe angulata]|uniref:Uncharacterized protein n=1 Tax=Ephemerocybe angulata TaxID=980116 RepID=A0A8H5C674_9AGAR|nr:hypothetical protein D9611_009734 [Tulosesus angulatus]